MCNYVKESPSHSYFHGSRVMIGSTLVYLIDHENEAILLAMKKRGFGAGKVNGPGGKRNKEESFRDCAVRECVEETGLTPLDLVEMGVVTFIFPGKREWDQECHVFVGTKWEGTMQETNEMLPQWFPLHSLPFSQMWDDDPLWLPRVVHEKLPVRREFHFDINNSMRVLLHINNDP
ncbi:NUDIX hydrolase [Pelomyxa schiedti]|nr:NUDIX hydrolase [Pelomyxa schiedti]